MKIRFYGPLAEMMGAQIDVDVPCGSCVGDVRDQLRRGRPDAAAQLSRSCAIIGNQRAREDHRLGAADQLEFLPPVSGG